MDEAMKQIVNEANTVDAERYDERAILKEQHRQQLAAHDVTTRALEASSRMAMRKHAAQKAKENADASTN